MSTFIVSHECRELGLRAGALLLHDARITEAPPELRAAIDREAQQIRESFDAVAGIRQLPELARVHQVLRAVGVKPKSHPPSPQKLFEFAWKQGTLPAVNNLVDAYNLISLRTRCSLGAHDVDRIALPVELRLFAGDESFRPLGSVEDKPIKAGEFGYVDAMNRVICRLDSLQADFSKVTTDTTAVLLIIEASDMYEAASLRAVFDQTIAALDQFCPATAEVVALP